MILLMKTAADDNPSAAFIFGWIIPYLSISLPLLTFCFKAAIISSLQYKNNKEEKGRWKI
jgi:hypothetical protein